ncbi:MAG: CDP-glucose 4,6-dehydratase [Bacteriovorax sp.]|nr:CDP-glucose 4,6-dehydratase [Bacteriovorax sp.]
MFQGIFKGKKVFVTGHTGFKGSWLASWLIQLGAEVKGYSIDIPTEPSHFSFLKLENHMIDSRGDIKDLENLKKEIQSFSPEFIFHMAAMPIVNDCLERPRDAFETNLMGSVNILEAVKHTSSVKVVLMITSDKCYENVEWEYGYRETDRLGGKDPYSASKACAEIAIHAYYETYLKNSSVKIASVRAGNVIGGGDWARDRIVADLVRAWSNSGTLQMKNPHSTRPWQHVLEPLSGYLNLAMQMSLGKDALDGEAFNLGPNSDVIKSVEDLVLESLKTWKGQEYKATAKPTGHESRLLKLSCDKALARLGWTPVLNFSETIEMTIQWYKNYYEKSVSTQQTHADIKRYVELAVERGLPWAK